MDRVRRTAPFLFPAKDTTHLREALQRSLQEIGQPRRILKAVDAFREADDSHQQNVNKALGLGLASASALTAAVQSSFDVAAQSSAESGEPHGPYRGLSAANIVSAALGLYAVTVAVRLWYANRADFKDMKLALDNRLVKKLEKHAQGATRAFVNLHGRHLISDFSALSAQDQRAIRTALAASAEPKDN